MTALPAKTDISDTYPNPSNAKARAGFAQLWDAVNEVIEKPELDLASATTCDIGGQLSTKLRITGTTTITSFGTNYRGPIPFRTAGILTITHNSTTLICPEGANITTAAGDMFMAWPKSTTSGMADGWQVVRLARGSGLPAFGATHVSQSLTTTVATKLSLTSELFDTSSSFASSRFTVPIGGYYLFNFAANITGATLTNAYAALYKNGAALFRGAQYVGPAITVFGATGAFVVYLVAGDYVELYGYAEGTTLGVNNSFLTGALLRYA